MKVPVLDLKAQYQTIKDEILKVTEELYQSQQFIMGPQVNECEKAIAAYCGTKYAVGVSSGTDALIIALMAAGIGEGDLVITTPYTFFATVGSIVRLNARSLFVDIYKDTYNINTDLLTETVRNQIKKVNKKLKAIMPVHLFGQSAVMDPILDVAREYGLTIIEDAAQAIGAEYSSRDGIKRAGSMGEYGCFSFFPSKNLGAFGDGGVVTTNSEELYTKLKILRQHGSNPKYYHKVVGGNFRLDTLQAAIVLVKIKYLDSWSQKRKQNADTYRRLFEAAGLTDTVILPVEKEHRHIYNQYVIRVEGKRDELMNYLQKQDIGTAIYYPLPLHLQECFAFLGHKKGDFPVSEQAALTSLALPIYPELTLEMQEYVVEKIGEFYKQ